MTFGQTRQNNDELFTQQPSQTDHRILTNQRERNNDSYTDNPGQNENEDNEPNPGPSETEANEPSPLISLRSGRRLVRMSEIDAENDWKSWTVQDAWKKRSGPRKGKK